MDTWSFSVAAKHPLKKRHNVLTEGDCKAKSLKTNTPNEGGCKLDPGVHHTKGPKGGWRRSWGVRVWCQKRPILGWASRKLSRRTGRHCGDRLKNLARGLGYNPLGSGGTLLGGVNPQKGVAAGVG